MGVDPGGCHVAAPNNNVVAVGQIPGILPRRGADDLFKTCVLGFGTDGALQPAGSQTAEKGLAAAVLNLMLGAGIGIRQDHFGAVSGDQGFPAGGDFIHGFLPGDGNEFAFPLLPHPAQRRGNAPGTVDGALVMLHFAAHEAARHGMVRIAFDTVDAFSVGFHQQAAAVGAVIRAGRAFPGCLCHKKGLLL